MEMNYFCPKQPFFLEATSHYYKHIVGSVGISHFYSFIADSKFIDILGIPDGCIDIIYSCNPQSPGVFLYGTGLSPRPLKLISGEYYFGVRFLPGYIPKFSSISFAEIIEKDMIFEELLREASFDKIIGNSTFFEKIEVFLEMYHRNYVKDDILNAYELKYFIRSQIIKNNGSTSISQIAEEAGYSGRHITKVFKDNYGMSPKVFSEIIKFQHTLSVINQNEGNKLNFVSIAVENDYYDESHMFRFFKKYMKLTPKNYINYIENDLYKQKLNLI